MIKRRIRVARLRFNRMVSRFLPRAMVLIYHRVANLDSDPQKLSVSPENFDEHMDLISRNYYPISLNELVDGLCNGYVRDRAVVVTFDDGYADNYINACPILSKYNIPATVFVSSGYSGSKREFWWDELDRLILQQSILPDEIKVLLNGENWIWFVRTDEYLVDEQGQKIMPIELYMELCARLREMTSKDIDLVINQLREMMGDSGEARADYLPMSIAQLRNLRKNGLIEVGAHTRTHVNLAVQTNEVQQEEIHGSRSDLENILGDKVENFSYPFGTLNNYSENSIEIAKNAGFRSALANHTGNVTRLTRLYEIPRRMVRNWNGSDFNLMLEKYYSS